MVKFPLFFLKAHHVTCSPHSRMREMDLRRYDYDRTETPEAILSAAHRLK